MVMDVYFIAADFFRPKSRGIRLRLLEGEGLDLLELVIVVKYIGAGPDCVFAL